MRARSRWWPSVIMAAVMASSCTASAISTPVIRPPIPIPSPTTITTSTTAPPPTTTAVPRHTTTTTTTAPPTPPRALVEPCDVPVGTAPVVRGDPITASVGLTHFLVCGSTDVVVARPVAGTLPSRVARTIGAPLVYAEAATPYDPRHLGAARVWTPDPALVVAGSHAVLPLPNEVGDPADLVASLQGGEVTHEAVQVSIESAPSASTLVVVSPHRPQLGPVAAAAAEAVEASAVWSTPGDMRRRRRLAGLAETSDTRMLVGDFSPDASWQMDVLAAGLRLPGGGQVIYPGRRLVALYGHPHTPKLGVLGEQPIEHAVVRAKELAEPYATEDTAVIPAFEIIATTATASPGKDGDYSAELTVDELRPWVDAAGEAGYYVILDLQPGRADFLSQARRYEDLLRLPHVGLALDPEWRLGRGDLHLRQIGSVSGAEVNTVVRWLADLVRNERLPQKLLVLHQFKLSMITERETIESPPELAVVIQMDGQGPLGTKYDTWNALLGADDRKWWWGWKNFFDEDSPTPGPDQVFDLDPDPVFVSYQ